MTKKAVSVRFLVLFLLLSFLIFNIACLPIFQNADSFNVIASNSHDKVDASIPVSLFIHGNLDSLEAENVAYRIGSDQTFLVRKLSSESFISLFLEITLIFFSISNLYPINNQISEHLSTIKITKFMRTKDGMI